MRVILSPAKTMRIEETILPEGTPVFLEQAVYLSDLLKKMTPAERRTVWNCSERLAAENEERLAAMNLYGAGSPAVFSYSGLAYSHLAPESLTDDELAYLQSRLRILSGLYGILKPLDGIVPYRLELGAKFRTDAFKDLYAFWGSGPADELFAGADTVIDLASDEYSRLITPWISGRRCMIHIIFAERKNGKLITKGTFAKMARGDMMRWMAEQAICDPQEIKSFERGYRFSQQDSDETHYCFLKVQAGDKTKEGAIPLCCCAEIMVCAVILLQHPVRSSSYR